jgi:hypothetical protein
MSTPSALSGLEYKLIAAARIANTTINTVDNIVVSTIRIGKSKRIKMPTDVMTQNGHPS